MKQSLSIFSFFSGAGFLDLGFEDAGYKICFVNEFFEPFLGAYKHSRKKLKLEEPEYGYFGCSIEDFLKAPLKKELLGYIKEQKLSSLVGFIGGPPCPDFSVGGKNRGSDGENGKLSATYISLIIAQKPDFFIFENVKGLYRTKRHREFFEGLKVQLEKGGYKLQERLINAIEYGVPQDRERVILVGVLESHAKSLSNPILEWNNYIPYPDREAFKFNWPKQEEFFQGGNKKIPANVPAELTVEQWFRKNGVSAHTNAQHFFKPRAGLARFEAVEEGDVSRKSFKRLHRWRYSPTACYGNNEVHLHPYLPRRLNVAEVLAIQSLPKEFELPPSMTLSNMFKTVGNGVPYLAALGIANTLKDLLIGQSKANSIRSSKGNFAVAARPCV